MQRRQQRDEEKKQGKRIAAGFPAGPAEEDLCPPPTLEEVAKLDNMDDQQLARKLAVAIRRTANDLNADAPKRYSYEEWAQYTRLIRFTRIDKDDLSDEDEDFGLIDWDWIGEDSPMLAEKSESEWILDRLCESLDRFLRKTGMSLDDSNDASKERGKKNV